MAYDRIDWHSGGDFPADLPPESGGTHIGMFLAWAINNRLEGQLHREEITGREFLSNQCDEKLWEDDLSEEGNAFAKAYYETNRYYSDYEAALGTGLPSLYHIEDSWQNYERIAEVLDRRFHEWQKAGRKRWWQFWK